LWQHLPLVQNNPVIHLPATWSFGGILAARRFATLLDGALQEQAVHRATGDQINELFSFFAAAAPGSLPVGADTGAGLRRAGASTAGGALVAGPVLPELDDARQAVVHFSWLPRLPSACWPVPPSGSPVP
jgi:hypothetical protein